jgi:hypothetical protein
MTATTKRPTAIELAEAEEELAVAARRYAARVRAGRPWLAVSVMLLTDATGAIPARVVVVEPEAVAPSPRAEA